MISYSGPVVTRDKAKELGLTRYFTGMRCRSGHLVERGTSDGKCIECVAIRYRRYAAANKGRIADYKRRWRQENPNALRDWHARNPSKAPQYKKAEYERDADKIKARVKRHRKDNPEMYAAVSRNKRARKRSAGGTHSADDIASIRKMQRDRCANCQTKLDGGGHVDHIFPLAKGGSNDRRNLQLLCARCNTTKHAKDPLTFARENGRLL